MRNTHVGAPLGSHLPDVYQLEGFLSLHPEPNRAGRDGPLSRPNGEQATAIRSGSIKTGGHDHTSQGILKVGCVGVGVSDTLDPAMGLNCPNAFPEA